MKKRFTYSKNIILGLVLGIFIGISLIEPDSNEGMRFPDSFENMLRWNRASDANTYSKAPDFSLYTVDGELIKLNESIGTPLIINFWASWCVPCLLEMPLLQAVFDQHQSEISILAVNVGESKKAIQKFSEENELTIPTLVDITKTVSKIYKVSAFPTTYFIDRDGVIQAIHVGILSEDKLGRYLSEIGVVDD